MREGSANLQALEESKEPIRLKGKQLDVKQAEKIKADWSLIYLEHLKLIDTHSKFEKSHTD